MFDTCRKSLCRDTLVLLLSQVYAALYDGCKLYAHSDTCLAPRGEGQFKHHPSNIRTTLSFWVRFSHLPYFISLLLRMGAILFM